MLTSIALIFASITMGVFIDMGGLRVVWEDTKDKWRRFRKLNNLVSSQYKTGCMIFWVSIQILCKALWLSFVQWMNNSVKKLGVNTYEVSYVVNGRLYKMLVKPIRGPSPVLLAVDENQNDITSQIVSYLGPRHEFHRTILTPNVLGYTKITMELSNGETVVFEKKNVLVVNE